MVKNKRRASHDSCTPESYWKLHGLHSFALTSRSIKRFSIAIRYEGRLLGDFSWSLLVLYKVPFPHTVNPLLSTFEGGLNRDRGGGGGGRGLK